MKHILPFLATNPAVVLALGILAGAPGANRFPASGGVAGRTGRMAPFCSHPPLEAR